MEIEATAFAEQVAAIGRRISGVIRVTTNEGLANVVMAPALNAFRRLHPQVRIDLIVDERRIDLMRGAADVALRTGTRPTEHGLVGRRLPAVAWAVYAGRDYLRSPQSPRRPPSAPAGRAEGPIGSAAGLALAAAMGPRCGGRGSLEFNHEPDLGSEEGLGLSVLPCFLAEPDPGLVRCMDPIEGAESDLRLVTREDLRDVRRIRAFVDFLAAHVNSIRSLLSERKYREMKAGLPLNGHEGPCQLQPTPGASAPPAASSRTVRRAKQRTS